MNQEQHNTIKDLSRFNDLDLIKYFKKFPDSLAFFPLSRRLLMLGKREQALKICLNGLHHHDSFIEGRILLAKIYLQLKDVVNGIDILKGVIRRDPENVTAYFLIAKTLLKDGHQEQGEALLMKAYELDPKNGEIKSCFQKYIKGESHSTSTFNINQFMTRSEHDSDLIEIPDSPEQPAKTTPRRPRPAPPAPIEDFTFLDEIEAEFSSGSKKIVRMILMLAIVALAAIPAYLFITSSTRRSEAVKQEDILKQFNQNPVTITEMKLKTLPEDIKAYHTLLQHFLMNREITITHTGDSIYSKLYQLLNHLYHGEITRFDHLLARYRVDLKDQGELYYLQGFRQLLGSNTLNILPMFQKAVTLSPDNQRYRNMVAIISIQQQNHHRALELLPETDQNDEVDYLKTFARTHTPPGKPLPIHYPESHLLTLHYLIAKQQNNAAIKVLKLLLKNGSNPYYRLRIEQVTKKIDKYENLMK